jgi:nitrate/nitrite transport system ATP-binding protein
VLDVPLPRPRSRRGLLAHPRYYELREELIGFLEDCEHPGQGNSGSDPDSGRL